MRASSAMISMSQDSAMSLPPAIAISLNLADRRLERSPEREEVVGVLLHPAKVLDGIPDRALVPLSVKVAFGKLFEVVPGTKRLARTLQGRSHGPRRRHWLLPPRFRMSDGIRSSIALSRSGRLSVIYALPPDVSYFRVANPSSSVLSTERASLGTSCASSGGGAGERRLPID